MGSKIVFLNNENIIITQISEPDHQILRAFLYNIIQYIKTNTNLV